MTTLHPRRRAGGTAVIIENPTQQTGQDAWYDAERVATVLPGGELPACCAHPPFRRFHGDGLRGEDWERLTLRRDRFDEPPFVPKPRLRTAAGVIVREPDGRIWVVHPTNRFGGYEATFPKGTREQGGSLQATALMECYEETGLRVHLTGFLGDFDRGQSRTRFYVGKRIDGSPADMGWESQAVSLVPVSSLASLLTSRHDAPVLAALLESPN